VSSFLDFFNAYNRRFKLVLGLVETHDVVGGRLFGKHFVRQNHIKNMIVISIDIKARTRKAMIGVNDEIVKTFGFLTDFVF